jgi:hypothetical protein
MSTKPATTAERLASFYHFATDRLAEGGAQPSLDELYDEWRIENPTPEEFAANVAAIQEALDEMNSGVPGRDAGEIVRELREKYQLPWAE